MQIQCQVLDPPFRLTICQEKKEWNLYKLFKNKDLYLAQAQDQDSCVKKGIQKYKMKTGEICTAGENLSANGIMGI
jgi:oligoendopeptidase F